MTPILAEVFAELKDTKSKNKKLKILHRFDNDPSFKEVCALAVNPHIKWLLPEGEPPYNTTGQPDNETVIWTEIRRFYVFVECDQSAGLSAAKREQIYIEMLESMHPKDARFLIDLKNGEVKGITEKLIHEAWPGYLTY